MMVKLNEREEKLLELFEGERYRIQAAMECILSALFHNTPYESRLNFDLRRKIVNITDEFEFVDIFPSEEHWGGYYKFKDEEKYRALMTEARAQLGYEKAKEETI